MRWVFSLHYHHFFWSMVQVPVCRLFDILCHSPFQVPADCRSLIEELKGSTQTEFLHKLRGIETWTYGMSIKFIIVFLVGFIHYTYDIFECILDYSPAKLGPLLFSQKHKTLKFPGVTL